MTGNTTPETPSDTGLIRTSFLFENLMQLLQVVGLLSKGSFIRSVALLTTPSRSGMNGGSTIGMNCSNIIINTSRTDPEVHYLLTVTVTLFDGLHIMTKGGLNAHGYLLRSCRMRTLPGSLIFIDPRTFELNWTNPLTPP